MHGSVARKKLAVLCTGRKLGNHSCLVTPTSRIMSRMGLAIVYGSLTLATGETLAVATWYTVSANMMDKWTS